MTGSIPIIDIFAGPGGLGEGFSALCTDGHRAFRIALSIEMDRFAHRTLLLRSFFRQFDPGEVPASYYMYLRGEGDWANAPLESLLDRYPAAGQRALKEAWKEELRPDIAHEVDSRIRNALGTRPTGSPWVLVGGPPCQAYSIAGRSRMLGPMGNEFYADHRHTLYKEYLRLLKVHRPSVFIMENVKGLLSATNISGDRVFGQIVSDLESPGKGMRYRLFSISKGHSDPLGLFATVDDFREFIIAAERHGIPQARHRLIILGVLENEYGKSLRIPRRLPEEPNILTSSAVIDDLPRLRSGLSREPDSAESWRAVLQSACRATWFKHGNLNGHAQLLDVVERAVTNLRVPRSGRGGRFVPSNRWPTELAEWFHDPRLGGALNHEARTHKRDDLHRYLFAAAYGKALRVSPRLSEFPAALLPDHANAYSGAFEDRFRVQLAHQPATTVTSHISKDGHYFIHHDPSQCRSLTVREAARLQTFPDNYFFEGPRTEQYRQVGNAVPPLLAWKIAAIVAEGMESGWS